MSRALRLLTRLAALPLAVVLLALLLVASGVMLAGKVLFVLIAAAIEAVTSV